ncbi:hypothetical protein HQ584_12590 [Patescibacteria group bacterium]|nr:hypothetical protein [Patescibacteria group bacterium]
MEHVEYKLNSYSKIIELKRLMTDVAKGKITRQEADMLIKPEKVAPKQPEGEIEVVDEETSPKTQKRKLNAKGGKK